MSQLKKPNLKKGFQLCHLIYIKPYKFSHPHCSRNFKIITTFDWTNRTACPSACVSYTFHQKSIQYAVKMDLQKSFNLPEFGEKMNTLHFEGLYMKLWKER